MQDSASKELKLFKMKLVATSLLVVAVIAFFLSAYLEEHFWWLGFVRATSEAAIAGAIADWFAVTALFQHPLGLKIPHTAIIPTQKKEIAEGFGKFVRERFLSEEIILQKWESMDATRKAAEWISQRKNSEQVADQIVDGIAAMVELLKDEDIQSSIESRLAKQIRSLEFAPRIGYFLELFVSSSEQQEILSTLGEFILGVLKENRDVIVSGIRRELPRLLKGVDKAIYNTIVDTVDGIIQEVSTDPNHPIREKLDTVVQDYIEKLQNSPDVRGREDEIKDTLLKHPVFQELAASLWKGVKDALIQPGSYSNQDLRQSIQKLLVDSGEAVLREEALFKKVDRWVKDAVSYVVEKYGHELGRLISDTIDNWDEKKTSREIELQVGKDLQYIRINGTIIGGLVGFVIYTIFFVVKLM